MDEKSVAAGPNRYKLALFRRLKRQRTRGWVVYCVLVLITLSLAYLHFTSPPPLISRENYERIREGMPEGEIERMVGARPGGYEWFWGPGAQLSQEWAAPQRWSRWGNSYGILSVGYNAKGQVCCKRLEYNSRSVPERPELWSWWKRLVHRSVPWSEPAAIYSPF